MYGNWRSAAAFRVRIALKLKGIAYEETFIDLDAGDQHAPEFRAINPQGAVPALFDGDGPPLTQSLAICEWLEEGWPEPPLLPREHDARAAVRAFAMVVACDIHPVQNLKVLQRLRQAGLPEAEVRNWARWTVREGLEACETLLARHSSPFCFGNAPGLADLCLVPQLGNARRFGCDLSALPRLIAAEAACAALPAFAAAAPDRQPDAE